MIDASIPLQVRPAPVENPMNTLAGVLNLQHAATANQVAQANLERTKIENERDKRAMVAQEALGNLISQNMKVDDSGAITVNHGAVQKGLADLGFGMEAQKYDATRRADLKAAWEATEAQIKMNQQKSARLGALAGSVPPVDWSATDPAVKQTQITAATAAVGSAVGQAVKEGLMDQPTAAQIVGQVQQGGYTPQVEQELQQFQKQAMTAEQQHSGAIAELEQARKKTLFDVELPGKQAESWQKAIGVAAQQAASISNQAQWDAWRAKQPASVQGDIPTMYSPTAVQQLHDKAITPEQQERNDARADALDWRKNYQQQFLDFRRDMAATRAENASNKKEQTANSRAIDARAAKKEFYAAEEEEAGLNTLIRRLRRQIQSNEYYIDDKGQMKQMSKAAGEQSVDELKADMRDRLDQSIQKLKTVVNRKYDAMETLGGTPKVSREEVLKAIDGGEPTVSTKATTQATTQAQTPKAKEPAAAAKTFPRTRLADYGKANGWTPAQTEQYLKSQGYAIR